jgi:hypothetical protein
VTCPAQGSRRHYGTGCSPPPSVQNRAISWHPGADALAGTAPARDLLILTALAAAALIGAVTSFTRRDLTR